MRYVGFFCTAVDLKSNVNKLTSFIIYSHRETATVADAVHRLMKLDEELPKSISEAEYYKKQRKTGVIPVSVAAYLLHPKYKG